MDGESGLGPMGDVHLLAAALRADRADVESYARVFSAVLGDALPAVPTRGTAADGALIVQRPAVIHRPDGFGHVPEVARDSGLVAQ